MVIVGTHVELPSLFFSQRDVGMSVYPYRMAFAHFHDFEKS